MPVSAPEFLNDNYLLYYTSNSNNSNGRGNNSVYWVLRSYFLTLKLKQSGFHNCLLCSRVISKVTLSSEWEGSRFPVTFLPSWVPYALWRGEHTFKQAWEERHRMREKTFVKYSKWKMLFQVVGSMQLEMIVQLRQNDHFSGSTCSMLAKLKLFLTNLFSCRKYDKWTADVCF